MAIIRFLKKILLFIKDKCYTRKEKEHSEKYNKRIAFLNKYSLVFHAIMAVIVIFLIEVISRRNFIEACSFVVTSPLSFFYNAFLIFATLTIVYAFRRRMFFRILILFVWCLFGIINGCVLSKRVTPFGFTDLRNISEMFSMTNSGYFTKAQLIGIIILLIFAAFLFSMMAVKLPLYKGKRHVVAGPIVAAVMVLIIMPVSTTIAQQENVVDSYYANIAQGYKDNGFVYSFYSSIIDIGMKEPDDYTEESVKSIIEYTDKKLPADEETQAAAAETVDDTSSSEQSTSSSSRPNIICVLLESFCDPNEIKYLNVSGGDPIPTFHSLQQNYSTGYLTVPVVGAGTANSEFEMLTGMSLQYFGTGEYPYKTILKKTDCESIASDLSKIGYSTHVVHNNGGNFYSRRNAFSMFGFDTFTSKEMMNIREYTPTFSWAEDSILSSETIKTLDATPDQPDFTYTITVGTHGAYPTDKILLNPKYTVTGALTEDGEEAEAEDNQWTYYVNQLHKTDEFISDLIEELSQRDEDTILVLWGDHLPTMGLEDDDMKSGSIYKTQYVTWNNMGLEKNDVDLYAYQLLAAITAEAGIHEGTMMRYQQAAMADETISTTWDIQSQSYLDGMEQLQYDILYGDRYCYDGEDAYPASDLEMGIEDVEITSTSLSSDETMLYILGSNFTNWSYVYVNGEKVATNRISSSMLKISASDVKSGDTIVVNQLGSKDTIFRSSNEVIYEDTGTENSE